MLVPAYRRLLSGWLPAARDAVIYEVACGPGIMLRFLREAGYTRIGGSDTSEEQITLARAANLRVSLSDSVEEVRRKAPRSLDCLIAIDFIEHLPKDALIDFFGEVHRVLNSGGCCILRAPNGDSPLVGRNLFNDITHYWCYTSIALQALLRMAGFERVEFADESTAMLQRHRWLKVPVMKTCQALLRLIIRLATRENIRFLNPSLYVCAWK
jgi:2-polyprenyl-3-methyl-5-hydroxy-6-metoxy-1,4-benzoquinol methylase